ncbi:MAG: hypothetical protein L0H73_13275 [Nitrococcus sp.]|nr:hypothetical protein [Nitrococcus sp.]
MVEEIKQSGDEEVEIISVDKTEALKALVRRWHERVNEADADMDKQRKRWRALRKIALTGLNSAQREDQASGQIVVSTNLIGSTKRILLPVLYARDPEISGRPAEQVDDDGYAEVRQFAHTYELVVNHHLTRDRALKRAMKRALSASMDTGWSWLKITWKDEREDNPLVAERMNDMRSQIERLRALAVQIADDDVAAQDSTKAEIAEIALMMDRLKPQLERVVFRGLVFERVLADNLIADPRVDELQDYQQGRWLAHRIWMTLCEAIEKLDLDEECLSGADLYNQPDGENVTGDKSAGPQNVPRKGDEDGKYLKVYEIWAREDGLVYTVVAGIKDRWAREPFEPVTPLHGTDRWFAFFLQAGDWVEGMNEPRSLVENLTPLQEEFTRTRTKMAVHRDRARPLRVFNTGVADTLTQQRLANGETMENVGLDMPPGSDVRQAAIILGYPPIDMGLYETATIRADMDQVSGVADQNRGATPDAKTATQASILQQGFLSRLSGPQDEIDDLLQDIASYAGGILRQEVTAAEALEIAGSGALWPQVDRSMDLRVKLDVAAGSTGQRDNIHQAQTWMQNLPQLVQIGLQIEQAESEGRHEIAEFLRAIVSKTFERLGLRVDVEALLPKQNRAPEPFSQPAPNIPQVPQRASTQMPTQPFNPGVQQ